VQEGMHQGQPKRLTRAPMMHSLPLPVGYTLRQGGPARCDSKECPRATAKSGVYRSSQGAGDGTAPWIAPA
jgi:hypothetical protein